MMGPGKKQRDNNGTLDRAGHAPPPPIPEEAARTYGSEEEMDPSCQMQQPEDSQGVLFPPLKMGHDREQRRSNEELGKLNGSQRNASKSAVQQLHISDEIEPRPKVSPAGSNSSSLFGSKSMHILNHVERMSEDSGLLRDGSSRFSAVPAVFRMRMALKDPAPVFRSKMPSQNSQWIQSKVTASLRPPVNRQDERSAANTTSEIKTKLRVSKQEERHLLIQGEMEVQNRIWSEKERSQLRQYVKKKKKTAKLERPPSKENNIPLFGA